jgi:hypothetical protein
MSGGLQPVNGGPPEARCVVCGLEAVGPCASCHDPLCGDCCVITEGGAKVWAICPRCDGEGSNELSGRWRGVVLWIGGPILLLAVLVLLLELLSR